MTDVAQRAAGYGMPGVIVDGNDAVEVYATVRAWVERARAGGGPVLIEAKTYRMRGHYVGDPQLYRAQDEVEAQKSRDPIAALQQRLLEAGIVDAAGWERMRREVEAGLAAAVEFGRSSPLPAPEEALEDVYVTDPGGWDQPSLPDGRSIHASEAPARAAPTDGGTSPVADESTAATTAASLGAWG